MRALIMCLACVISIISNVAHGEPSGGSAVQSGDIAIEDPSRPVLPRDERGVKEARQWLTSLRASLTAPAGKPLAELGDSGVAYLDFLYFFCSVRAGECPFILDTILAGDVVESKAAGEPGCPTMTRFWKSWLAGDFDERAKYKVSASSGAKLSAFNNSQRPRYIKCKETVAELMSAKSASEQGLRGLDRTEALLREVTDKGIDIFAFE